MSRIVILHGKPGREEYFSDKYPSGSNSHWIPWLQKQLLMWGYDVQTPEVIDAYKPDYTIWRTEFERHLVEHPMVFVGHSCGAGFLVRWLSEHPEVSAEKVVLVAPWLDPHRSDTTDFFEFDIDPRLDERVGELHLFNSTDDMESIPISVETLLTELKNVVLHEYDDMGHFCFNDMGTVEFPDLLTCITGGAGR